MNDKTKKYIRTGLALLGALGINTMVRSLIPANLNLLGKICCEVAIDILALGTYDLMAEQVVRAENDIKQLLDNGGFIVVR